MPLGAAQSIFSGPVITIDPNIKTNKKQSKNMKEYMKKAKRGEVGGPANLLARAPKEKAMKMIAATNMPNQFKLSKTNSVAKTHHHDNKGPSAKATYISNRISTLQ